MQSMLICSQNNNVVYYRTRTSSDPIAIPQQNANSQTFTTSQKISGKPDCDDFAKLIMENSFVTNKASHVINHTDKSLSLYNNNNVHKKHNNNNNDNNDSDMMFLMDEDIIDSENK